MLKGSVMLSPFHSEMAQRLNNLPQVTQLGSSGAEIQTVWSQPQPVLLSPYHEASNLGLNQLNPKVEKIHTKKLFKFTKEPKGLH